MTENPFSILLITGAIHGFLFVIIPILLKKRIGKPIWFLNGLVFFISLNNLQAWLTDNNYFDSLFYIKNLVVPWYMLVTPFFYTFVVHYLNIQDKINSFLKIALVFFIVQFFIRVTLIIFCQLQVLDNTLINNYTVFEEFFNMFFAVFIFYKCFLLIYRKKELHSYALPYTSFTWLRQFMFFGLVVVLFWLFAIVANSFTGRINNVYTYYPLRLASSVLIYWVGYQGLIRYNLMVDRISLRKEINRANISETIKTEKINLKDDKHFKTFEIIELYITKHKRYLDPLFGLHNLAIEMDLSDSQISKILNTYGNYNFSDYINKLRVEYAKGLLIDNNYKDYTIIAIGLECGFNSKSTFYSAFKKFTSQTPTAYKKRNIKHR
ncbi:helix-turn-helix domain-containing protein [Psychroserpens burtonensis]|uniref:helix-turn-helix domain-containing protein n=1 Tax=Psychroserpens burtonensis TaxID=49278 RepID=UPI000415408A|nr:helix-turn-helix domain-containing protein [Psychroserpens burtonensis]